MSSGTKKLHECPSNIKEALEWLAALGSNASQCAQVIELIMSNIDGNKAAELCDAANAFLRAIKKSNGSDSTYKDAKWSQLCLKNKKCCADSGGSGGSGCSNCNATSGSCDVCCKDCPQQICARIFCLIVPVVANVLFYLEAKCYKLQNGKNVGEWAKQQLDGKGTNSDHKSDLKDFLVTCGFSDTDLNATTGGSLTNSKQASLTTLVIALGNMTSSINEALQVPSTNFLQGATATKDKKPSSLTDLLLWLQFLPYCSKYKDVLDAVKKKINGNQGSNGNENIVTHLNDAISHLPMLFLQIEGPGTRSSGTNGSSLFLKISELSKCQYIFDQKYYNDKETVVKMLLCVFPVIHWGLNALKDRCQEAKCDKTIDKCDKTKKLLESLGWNGSAQSTNVSNHDPIIYEHAKCQSLKTYLGTLLGDSASIGGMKSILDTVWKAENAPTGFTSSGQYLPRTIYEMLIWLMGLPVSERYKELKGEITSKLSSNGVSVDIVMPQFTGILFEVPNLFLTLNGDLSGLLGNMYKCHGIGTGSSGGTTFTYGESGEACFKIFSAIVAILYPVIRYLQQRCKGDAQAFANGESWQNTQTHQGAPKTFLEFMGFGPTISSNNAVQGSQFHSTVLTPIFGDVTQNGSQTEKLNALYKCAKTKLNELSNASSSGSGSTPTTIRQMMLWLIGLPVTTQYGNGSSGLINTVTTKASALGNNGLQNKINNGHDSLESNLSHSIVGMMTVISQIEGGLESVLTLLKEGFKDNQKQFEYKSGQDLFTQFTSYVTSVHVQLRFLYVMCGRQKDQGGWQECKYGNGSCNCNGNVASCLKLFLQNGNNQGGSGNKFKLCKDGKQEEQYQMGFNQYPTQNNGSITGDHISTHLELMLDEIPTTQSGGTVEFKKPLSLLTQYCVAIGRIDPVSLGDHFDVFRELAGDMWSKIQEKVKTEIKGITTSDNNGQTASEKLKTALKEVWPGSHNGGTHDGDLRSLTGCSDTNNCTPFVATLSHGLYKYFDPKLALQSQPQPPSQAKTHIDWLYMKMSSLYGKLKKLLENMKKDCKCCPNGETKPTGCNGITHCPVCLPLMYKMGLVFGSAEQLSVKTCSELHTMMDKVLDAASALCLLFTKIETGRFKPYLLFSAMVVKGKYGQFTKVPNGDDDNYNCYTYKLKDMYEAYLKEKKEEDKSAAEKNKTARDNALKCCGTQHTYSAPAAGSGTATVVTLTLYFQGAYINTAITLSVPFHGPLSNPLVRFYPRNLKSIVDWLLRIGQTRLEQEGKDAGVTEMITMFWPKIGECLKEKNDVCKPAFEKLVTGVVKLMGMENQGKKEVETEVTQKLKTVQEGLTKKLNGGNGGNGGNGEGFNNTFTSILQFSPKDYIDKVFKDFGQKPSSLPGNSKDKRPFDCIAKSVSECMNTALGQIKQLATENKTTMQEYNVDIKEELNQTDIQAVDNLNGISNLKTLCDGFKKFKEVYDKVTGAFNNHLKTAQTNGTGKTHWDQITKCVEAFKVLGECVTDLEALNGMSSAEKMTQASTQLQALSTKLDGVIQKLNGEEIKTLSVQVEQFINKLDENVLKTAGEKALESALKLNDSKVNDFNTFLKSYVSELITQLKKNDQNNTVCDIHLRVRNDLLQLSECLKVMCEVCGTGMKEFAHTLKQCVTVAKDHLVKIVGIQLTLKNLKGHLHVLAHPYSTETIGMRKLTEAMEWSIRCVRSLFMSKYIYNPPIIVKEFIKNSADMTTYLKSLPDLIRDRYVLQKWTDSPEAFCGVQEFKDGIVKGSDINGITTVLQELLKDTFHTTPANDITIHDFQVRALIYNFFHKEAMEQIGSGARLLYFVSHYVNKDNSKSQGDLQWETIKDNKDKLKRVVDDICGNSYLKYFATHLRDSIGYHTLSNTLGALDKVKDKLGENNGSTQPSNWDNFKDLLKKDAIDQLHQRLQALVTQLNREYIFEYPPFDWQKSCKRLVREQTRARVARDTLAVSPAPSPSSTTCDLCVPSMAQIFVGFVPQMYRLFKMLREMTTKDGSEHKLEFNNNGTDATNRTMSSLAGLLSREGWRLKLGNETSGDPDAGEAFDLNDKKTGADVCKFLDDIIGDKEPGALVDKGGDASATDLKALDQLFKAVMQHFKDERKKKRQQREEKLKQEFDEKYKDSGLKFLAPPPVLPSTVRQVLFWLHELDTKGEFYNAMSQHIKNLCQAASRTVTITPSTILHVLKLSATQCLEVLATIEDPGRQNAQYYYELYTEEHYYAYPTVNIPLFFYTFVEKLMGAFLELNFVCVQCEFRALEGGWSECHIGEVYNKAYDISGGISCICHERKVAGPPMLRVEVEGSLVCPKPLSAFLFSDPKNQLRIPGDVSQRLPYMSKGTMPCGFQLKNKAITDPASSTPAPTPTPTSVSGSALVEPLRKLVGGHVTGRHSGTTTNGLNTLSTVIYLRDLLRYTLCLAVRPPWSMSENMAFFSRVTESWRNKGGGSVRVAHPNTQLLQSIHAEIALFPGTFKAELLTSAVERFAGLEDKERHDKTSATHSNTSHQFDLRTLMGCQENTVTSSGTTPVQCSPFMFPLALDVYTHYDHKNSRAYLSWILNFAFGIYGQLRGLEAMMKEKECVKTSKSSSCPSLPMCPGVLTALYQSGSSFMDQRQLAKKDTSTVGVTTTKKTCDDFHSVLQGLFSCNTANCTPLHNLIVQCEAFLWSIRLPFSLVQLSLWSVAILFISYVFVVPLDHFKIKSHLFNRLKYTMHPSLLIADGQRKVTEVAYFSL